MSTRHGQRMSTTYWKYIFGGNPGFKSVATISILTIEFLEVQTTILRRAVSVPMIFTIRTQSQGGKFPDDAHEEALQLYRAAARMCFDFIDLEIQFPDELCNKVAELKGSSKIIA